MYEELQRDEFLLDDPEETEMDAPETDDESENEDEVDVPDSEDEEM